MWLLCVVTIFTWLSISEADGKCGQQTVTLKELDKEVTFQQPSYPQGSSSYLGCEYKISAPKNARIRFWLHDFGVKTYGNSFYIWFFNGFSTASSDRFLILSNSHQTGLMQHSGSNTMTVKLRVPKSYSYTGFRIAYKAIAACGSRLEAGNKPQKLTSPGFPYGHLANQICLWTIMAPSDHVIKISVDKPKKRSCCDQLQIVGSKTDLSIPQRYTSSGKTIQIEFIANSSIGSSTFILSYRAEHICNNERLIARKDAKKTFHAPPFPSQYSSYFFNCWYTITSPAETLIQFSIDSLKTRYYYSYYVYLWFYNGLSEKDERFLVFDKKEQVSVVRYSKSNVMGIKLRAYRYYGYKGFQITYKAIEACGAKLTAESTQGIILSPGYPQRHLADQVCTWSISVRSGHQIKLSLKNTNPEPCCIEFKVLDSKKTAVEVLKNDEYISLGDKVELTFISTRSIARKEFQISYEDYFCGEKISAVPRPQKLKSPKYPLQHATYEVCSWTIVCLPGHLIEVKAHFVGNETCCSSVKIGAVELHTGNLYTSTGRSIRIDFVSQNSVMRKGFELQFRAVDACGQREFKAEVDVEKQLRPSLQRGAWESHINCRYTISAPKNTRILFWIDDFGTWYYYYYSYYYHLWFTDESEFSSKRFLSVTNVEQRGKEYFSPSNLLGIDIKIYLYFYTGFKMRYTAIRSCQTNKKTRVATDTTQFLFGSTASNPFQICSWTIRSSANHIIQVVPDHIDNETCCTKIEVIDPNPGYNTQLHTGQIYSSPGTSITINAISTNNTNITDFRLQFREVHVCGLKEYEAELNTETQIHLPGIPKGYGNYFNCWYNIKSPVQTRIRFWIIDFGTKRFHSSLYYLQFFDGFNELHTVKTLTLDRLSQAGVMQHSRSNRLGIKLRAYKPYGYTGFTMRYRAIHSCKEMILPASLVSQNLSYSGNSLKLYSEQICTWNINSEANLVIQTKVDYISSTTHSNILQFETPTEGSSVKLYTGQVFTSPGSSVAINLISTNSSKGIDFRLQYKAVHICGLKEYEAELYTETQIHLPGIPKAYGNYFNCWYNIKSPDQTRIRFWIIDFGTKRFHSYYFYLQCFDGFNELYAVKTLTLDRLSQAGVMQHSRSNHLGIKLRAYKPFGYSGFTIRYRAVHACKMVLPASSVPQNLSYSGNSLQMHSEHIHTWNITSEANHVIQTKVDYVSNTTHSSILQFETPTQGSSAKLYTGQVFTSPGSSVAINLISTNSSKGIDFRLQYRAVHVCGDLHYEAEINLEKTIHPPPFPSDYQTYLDCWYTISSPKNTKIRFWVASFGIRRLYHYYYYLWFYYGRKESSQRFLILNNAHQARTVHYSKSNELGIKLRARKYDTYTGFILKYSALRSCDDDLELSVSESHRSLVYPLNPLQRYHQEICSWTIRTFKDYVIELTPQYNSTTCCSVLQVEQLKSSKTVKLHAGKTYLSKESDVVITYASNNTLKKAELEISYRKVHVCGTSVLRAGILQKEFKAAPFPDSRSYFYCWYTVTSSIKARIGFWISNFGGRLSSYYYLKFYDGWQRKGSEFLTLNKANQIGALYYSKSDAMTIALKAYRWDYYTGFNMTYFAVSSCVNTELRATETPHMLEFSKSTFGNQSYGICGWHLTASYDYAIELTVLYIEEDNGNLQVVDSSLTAHQLRKGEKYRSSKKQIEIRLESEKINAFQIQYKAVHVCGMMNLKAELGTENQISQSGFFDNYGSLSCWYVIKSPETTKIKFSLSKFKFITSPSYFSLKFYDGLDENGKPFLTLGTAVGRSKVHFSKDNILGVKLWVYYRFNGYSGFSIDFSAVEVGDGNLIKIRVEFGKTYQLLVSKELMETYFLSKYETLDISEEIFQDVIKENSVKSQLVHGKEAPDFRGRVNVTVRVNHRWIFVSYMKSESLSKLRFNAIGINDVSLAVFSQVRESSDVIQLVKITKVESLNGTFVLVRIDFLSTYKVYLPSSIQTRYGLISPDINDVTSDLFDDIRKAASFIQLFSTEPASPPRGIALKVRVDFSLVYNTTMSDVVKTKYMFVVNATNDVSASVFSPIRKDANSVKLIYLETKTPMDPTYSLSLRVEFSRRYRMSVPMSLIEHFDFDGANTNDVTEAVFKKCLESAKYVQLFGYKPEVPGGKLATVRVGFTWNYQVALPKEVASGFFLSFDSINDVSKKIFVAIKPKTWVVQLSAVETPETPNNTFITIRVNFKGIYRTYVSQNVKEMYFPFVRVVNDISLNVFWELKNKTDSMQLIQLDKTVIVGTSIKVRIDQNRVYRLYIQDDVPKQYNFHSMLTNDISSSIFQQVLNVASFLQIVHVGVVNPTGVKVTVQVDYSQVYEVYVTQDLRRKYNFILGRTNEISNSAFRDLRRFVSVAKLISIKKKDITPKRGSLVRIRVDFKLVYDVYIADNIREQYYLQRNTTNDVSTEIFARVQGKANSFELVDVKNEFIADHKYSIRVDFHHVYRVAMDDETFSRYPLSSKTTNDVTSVLFAQIRRDAKGVQLAKLDNPTTITIRVDYNWVYRVVLTGHMQEQYNFSANATNDVTASIFTSLKKKASSVQILNRKHFDPTVGTVITIRVDSLRIYKVVCSPSVIAKYNLSVNEANVISAYTFQRVRKVVNALQLTKVESPDYCPSNNWTMWFNEDDPSGPCDCETLPKLRERNPGKICDKPTSIEARLENCMEPYDSTLPNIKINLGIGFKCENKDGIACLDYEVRFCCP